MNLKIFSCLAVMALTGAIFGCGGGTTGSGLKSYQGTLTSTQGESLSGVTVTIESTGDTDKTDSNGHFVINSTASGASVSFLLESTRFLSRFELMNVPDESSQITVNVTVNTETDTVEILHFAVRAWMVGLCDLYFENRETIRQSNQVPEGTVCSLNVRVLGDGQPASDLPVALQYAGCDPHSIWETLATSVTGAGQSAGATEFNFSYESSEKFCRYRVVAPFKIPASQAVYYPLDTFAEQKYFGSAPK